MAVEQVRIVAFEPRFAPGVAEVIVPIQREEFGIPISLDEQPDLRDIPGFYQRAAGNFWIGLMGDEVVATLGLLDIGNAQGALRKMFVKAAYRGAAHALARRLLDTLFAWAGARGLREIYLGTTAKFLAAHRFYEKNAFVEIMRTDLPPAFPVMAVDTRFYRRRLDGAT